jgi:23S rRNA pseudouridine1911/1915/1917 synthase
MILNDHTVDVDILFEDDHLIAVDKPAGVVVHPTYKNAAGTLLDALRAHGGGSYSPAIVGRLDKDTSGVVIAAKNGAVHSALQRILSTDESEKEYLAIVDGRVEPVSGVITVPLRVDPADRRRVVVSDEGRPCETRFEVLQRSGTRTLVRCRLITGRRHQIRVHLASKGWPIAGDAVYGLPLDGFRRHALHAWRSTFAHPATGARTAIEAPPPEVLLRLL